MPESKKPKPEEKQPEKTETMKKNYGNGKPSSASKKEYGR